MHHEFPFIVKARHWDPHKGMKSEGYDNEGDAQKRALELVNDASLSDVLMLEPGKGDVDTVVTEYKGKVWYLLGELDHHFPTRWRLSDAPPLPDVSDEVLRRDQINERMLLQMEQEEAQRRSSVQVSEA